ncbi:MAG: ABC transporter ATP-binding protein, partial [Bacteroidota bacterium]
FGLVGNNGAGKTTMFRLLLDLIKPSNGEVMLNENPVAGRDDWKAITGAFLDSGFLIDFFTPEEYFYFVGELRGLDKGQVQDFLAGYKDFFQGEILEQKKYLRDLSQGNQKKAGIIAALMGNPQLIILDEPFANLDPSTQIRLKNLLRELKESHAVTLLISSHDLNHVTEVCERIVVLEHGRISHDLQTEANTLEELEEIFRV